MTGKTKIIIAVLVIALLLATFSFFGCKEETVEDSIPSIEVVDGEGNSIVLDQPAEKIVVLAPSVLEIADGLNAMEKVVEIDNFSVMMGEPLAAGFEGVGDYQSLNVERIVELDPDILIAITGGPEDDYNRVAELVVNYPVYMWDWQYASGTVEDMNEKLFNNLHSLYSSPKSWCNKVFICHRDKTCIHLFCFQLCFIYIFRHIYHSFFSFIEYDSNSSGILRSYDVGILPKSSCSLSISCANLKTCLRLFL